MIISSQRLQAIPFEPLLADRPLRVVAEAGGDCGGLPELPVDVELAVDGVLLPAGFVAAGAGFFSSVFGSTFVSALCFTVWFEFFSDSLVMPTYPILPVPLIQWLGVQKECALIKHGQPHYRKYVSGCEVQPELMRQGVHSRPPSGIAVTSLERFVA